MPFDTTQKSSWWSVTCFNTEGKSQNIDIIEDVKTWPTHVQAVYGGREICPKTGRLHFQGAIQADYNRASKILAWLPGVHIEKVRDAGNLKLYAMKSDTAAGEKKEVSNPSYIPYMSADMLALLLAQQVVSDYDDIYMRVTTSRDHRDPLKAFNDVIWSTAFNRVLEHNDRLFGSMMNPSFKSAWLMSLAYWVKKARSQEQRVTLEVVEGSPAGGAGHSITPAPALDF